jgi:hypothetical protein
LAGDSGEARGVTTLALLGEPSKLLLAGDSLEVRPTTLLLGEPSRLPLASDRKAPSTALALLGEPSKLPLAGESLEVRPLPLVDCVGGALPLSGVLLEELWVWLCVPRRKRLLLTTPPPRETSKRLPLAAGSVKARLTALALLCLPTRLPLAPDSGEARPATLALCELGLQLLAGLLDASASALFRSACASACEFRISRASRHQSPVKPAPENSVGGALPPSGALLEELLHVPRRKRLLLREAAPPPGAPGLLWTVGLVGLARAQGAGRGAALAAPRPRSSPGPTWRSGISGAGRARVGDDRALMVTL